MQTVWIVLAGVVGGINLRLIIPGVAAFLGIGQWPAPVEPRPGHVTF